MRGFSAADGGIRRTEEHAIDAVFEPDGPAAAEGDDGLRIFGTRRGSLDRQVAANHAKGRHRTRCSMCLLRVAAEAQADTGRHAGEEKGRMSEARVAPSHPTTLQPGSLVEGL